eukprot:PhF_6_TR5657/c2_g2_i2/m.8295
MPPRRCERKTTKAKSTVKPRNSKGASSWENCLAIPCTTAPPPRAANIPLHIQSGKVKPAKCSSSGVKGTGKIVTKHQLDDILRSLAPPTVTKKPIAVVEQRRSSSSFQQMISRNEEENSRKEHKKKKAVVPTAQSHCTTWGTGKVNKLKYIQCYNCENRGHFGSMCPHGKRNGRNDHSDDDDDDSGMGLF